MSRRRVSIWDVLGIAAAVSCALLVVLVAAFLSQRSTDPPRSFELASWAFISATVLALCVASALRHLGALALIRLCARVWVDPPGPWVGFVVGAIVAIPMWALYSPIILGDADSARLIAGVNHVRVHGPGYLLETQDSLLPHVVIGPVVWLAGVTGAMVVAVASAQLCVAVTAYIAGRLTNSMLGAAFAALVLASLGPMQTRATVVPMYAVMLTLGYLGAWFTARALSRPVGWKRWAVGAGVAVVLANEAQGVGLLFLAAPMIVAVALGDGRRRWQVAAYAYVASGVVILPRLAINMSRGGLSRLLSNRTDYWVEKGYLQLIQREFWRYEGVGENPIVYTRHLPWRLVRALGDFGYVALVIAAIGVAIACSPRARRLVGLALGFFLLAMVVKRIQPFDRYFSPLWPGVGLLAAAGMVRLAHEKRVWKTGVVCVVTGALLAIGCVGLARNVRSVHMRQEVVEAGPNRPMSALINDGRGVIGVRSHTTLLNTTSDVQTWGDQFLSEQEYVTYLTWPSDEAVLEVLRRHNIGWVVLAGAWTLEEEYNDTWLVPTYGLNARQIEGVSTSPSFCYRGTWQYAQLYQVGPC
jgi:hypothetical protein